MTHSSAPDSHSALQTGQYSSCVQGRGHCVSLESRRRVGRCLCSSTAAATSDITLSQEFRDGLRTSISHPTTSLSIPPVLGTQHSESLGKTMPLVNRPCWVCGKIWTEYADQVCYICKPCHCVSSDLRSPRNTLHREPAPTKDGSSLHSHPPSLGHEGRDPGSERQQVVVVHVIVSVSVHTRLLSHALQLTVTEHSTVQTQPHHRHPAKLQWH